MNFGFIQEYFYYFLFFIIIQVIPRILNYIKFYLSSLPTILRKKCVFDFEILSFENKYIRGITNYVEIAIKIPTYIYKKDIVQLLYTQYIKIPPIGITCVLGVKSILRDFDDKLRTGLTKKQLLQVQQRLSVAQVDKLYNHLNTEMLLIAHYMRSKGYTVDMTKLTVMSHPIFTQPKLILSIEELEAIGILYDLMYQYGLYGRIRYYYPYDYCHFSNPVLDNYFDFFAPPAYWHIDHFIYRTNTQIPEPLNNVRIFFGDIDIIKSDGLFVHVPKFVGTGQGLTIIQNVDKFEFMDVNRIFTHKLTHEDHAGINKNLYILPVCYLLRVISILLHLFAMGMLYGLIDQIHLYFFSDGWKIP